MVEANVAIDSREVRNKYNRTSRFYNVLEWPMELAFYRRWRRSLFTLLRGSRILEVGLGTGKNLPFYRGKPWNVTAVELSEGMLSKARADDRIQAIALVQADAQYLPFRPASFDAVLATFVFCSVPDPVQGFREIRRVLRPGGRLYLLEHVLPENPLLARLFNRLNPLTVQRVGVNINRKTAENIRKAGFELEVEKNLLSTIFKLFVARPG